MTDDRRWPMDDDDDHHHKRLMISYHLLSATNNRNGDQDDDEDEDKDKDENGEGGELADQLQPTNQYVKIYNKFYNLD